VPYVRGRGKIFLGDDVYISGRIGVAFNSRLDLQPELRIGNGSFVGHECSFSLARGITIGEHCLVAAGTKFFDNDGHPQDHVARRRGLPVAKAAVLPIKVGNDVWIGSGCLILKGVQIGDRAIVGARSVVTKDVPNDSIVAGHPAHVIGVATDLGYQGRPPCSAGEAGELRETLNKRRR
jgi:acetyltransferase-like isoleucine patch superfamily enzyme